VYQCAAGIEKGREACTESPTIGEERIKEEMGKKFAVESMMKMLLERKWIEFWWGGMKNIV